MPAGKKLNPRKIIVFVLAAAMLFFAREPNVCLFMAGIVLAAVGEWLRLWGAGHLTKNVALTTSGPYAHLKHPLYVGTFLVMMGLLLAATVPPDWVPSLSQPNLYVLVISFLVFVFYYFPYKKANEAERLIRRLGEPARHWVESVPEFFPRIKPYEKAEKKKWSMKQTAANSEAGVPLAIAAGFIIIARAWWLPHIADVPDWLLGKF
jgi:protein-S-isoprenylcysteine O-methyltransferase Ste14